MIQLGTAYQKQLVSKRWLDFNRHSFFQLNASTFLITSDVIFSSPISYEWKWCNFYMENFGESSSHQDRLQKWSNEKVDSISHWSLISTKYAEIVRLFFIVKCNPTKCMHANADTHVMLTTHACLLHLSCFQLRTCFSASIHNVETCYLVLINV